MANVSALTRPDIVTAVADIAGEQVTVEFDRSRVTLNWLAQVQEAQTSLDARAIAGVTAQVLHSWDVVNDDGSPYPLTAESLAALPATVLGALSDAVAEATAPSSAEGNESSPSASGQLSATSEPTSPSSPNGSDGSTSQSVSASPSLR